MFLNVLHIVNHNAIFTRTHIQPLTHPAGIKASQKSETKEGTADMVNKKKRHATFDMGDSSNMDNTSKCQSVRRFLKFTDFWQDTFKSWVPVCIRLVLLYYCGVI